MFFLFLPILTLAVWDFLARDCASSFFHQKVDPCHGSAKCRDGRLRGIAAPAPARAGIAPGPDPGPTPIRGRSGGTQGACPRAPGRGCRGLGAAESALALLHGRSGRVGRPVQAGGESLGSGDRQRCVANEIIFLREELHAGADAPRGLAGSGCISPPCFRRAASEGYCSCRLRRNSVSTFCTYCWVSG